jgi:glycosyltransferase involved in cell wall biosynthesis
LKICRVSQTSPTDNNNGKGLHCYHVSNLMEYPTLVLTKNYEDEKYWEYKNHVTLKKINYFQFPFPKENKIAYNYILAILSYIIGQITFFFKSIDSLIRFKPNIVHLQSPHAILIGIFCKLAFKSKLVITFHGSDLRRIKKNKIFLLILRCADRLLYVDKNMSQALINYFPKEILIHTPSGIDIDFYIPLNLPRKKQIITVGNLRWQKDHETLIKAFKLFLKTYPDYQLLIVGEGDQREKLMDLAKKLYISDKINLSGRKNQDQVLAELNCSKFFVLSSVTEGMPKALIEALATNTPTVVTNVGSCKTISKGAGYSIEPSDHIELSQAMIKMIADEVKYKQFLIQGRMNVIDYSWKSLAEKVHNTFINLKP